MTSGPAPMAELSGLQDMAISELELVWRRHLGGTMPHHLPKFLLARALAYRLQVREFGGLSKAASRYLDQIAGDIEAGREPSTPYPSDSRIKPGCVITREYDGVQHRVMVLEEGYAWNGKTFGSLSAVAKAISGTSWSGQRFFGLKSSGAAFAEVVP